MSWVHSAPVKYGSTLQSGMTLTGPLYQQRRSSATFALNAHSHALPRYLTILPLKTTAMPLMVGSQVTKSIHHSEITKEPIVPSLIVL